MGNIKSKPENKPKNNSTFISLSFQKEDNLEIISPKLTERKFTGDIKLSYYKLSTRIITLVNKNYPFHITLIRDNKYIDTKYLFSESYRTDDKNYTINQNYINGYRWLDYSPKKKPFIKIRHNKHLEPCEIIINEHGY